MSSVAVTTIFVYCVLIVFASLAGGWLPTRIHLSHLRMQMIMSLVSGIMLGVAVLHMLPNAMQLLPIDHVAYSMLAGLLVMFFLLRIFHVHHHGEAPCQHHEHGHDENAHHDHDSTSVSGGHSHSHTLQDEGAHRFSWTGLFFGLAVHTFIDGVALAASVQSESTHVSHSLAPLGLATFLAVALHKPLDALSITSIMRTGKWTINQQMVVNCCFAMACPLGAILFVLGAQNYTLQESGIVGYALGFSAGFFLCIALGDLLPEVQFHSHDRWKLSVALVLGVLLAVIIESFHSHEKPGFNVPNPSVEPAGNGERVPTDL